MATLTQQLSNGGRVFATWVALGNTYSAEMIGAGGYDCVVLDTQHGAVGWDQLGDLVRAIDLNHTPSLVRVGGADGVQIMRALDLGAAGVIVPMVSNPEQAKLAVAATRYPPQGERSFGKVRNYYGGEQTESRAPLCFVMIETAEALEKADAIAAVEGVDGLFVGPVDLALAMGLGPVLAEHDEVFTAIERIVEAADVAGKFSGSASFNSLYTRRLLSLGVQLVVQGSDLGMIRRSVAEDIRQFGEALTELVPDLKK